MSGGQNRGKIKKKREQKEGKGMGGKGRYRKCFLALNGHALQQMCLHQNEERVDTELAREDIFVLSPYQNQNFIY